MASSWGRLGSVETSDIPFGFMFDGVNFLIIEAFRFLAVQFQRQASTTPGM